jgi:hypothetical protein
MISEIDLRARNSALFNLSRLRVTIIGCGSIGSFTASTLTRMGVDRFNLFDGDSVGPENIGVQDFTIHQLDVPKVEAVKQNIMSINPLANVSTVQDNITKESSRLVAPIYGRVDSVEGVTDVVVMAVDSMEARMDIIQSKAFRSGYTRNDIRQDTNEFCSNSYFFDARMGSETFQLYKFQIPFEIDNYLKTWYSDEDGDPEPCSARSTAYCSTFAGSIIASEIKKCTNGGMVAEKILFGFPSLLLNAEIDYPKFVENLKKTQ